ncbi:MAG: hypothetical protein M1818_000986 [Claussenomyces sp. TS43310]|nr:MAG: hypothetical protein M1818_000986 [Claussenomyces sp. TS43310]
MSEPLATVGILSIGDMGMGVAQLLRHHGYRVLTNAEGRSQDTRDRIQEANIEIVSSDSALVEVCDYILSIVPPRDAFPTAQRISSALSDPSRSKRAHPLYYLDLNAISPRTARATAALFTDPQVACFLDGGIIGHPPTLKSSPAPSTTDSSTTSSSLEWKRPSIPISGPNPLSSAPRSGSHLAETLNIKHVSPDIGPASGLKCCFATMSKGYIALAIQAFTTAEQMGVLPELKEAMSSSIPAQLERVEKGMTSMPPKAYRWVREMQEIGECHAAEGGFAGAEEERSSGGNMNIFAAVANVYKAVAEDTVLGEERTGKRKRGGTVEDVASAMSEGLQRRMKKRA